MSKIVMIYHSVDLDGYMSAAIVKHWFATTKVGQLGVFKNDSSIIIKPFDTLTFIGYNYGQPIPSLAEYDQVIMCDISFPLANMIELAPKLIWIDHHESAILTMNGSSEFMSTIKDRNTRNDFAACELTWKYFFPNQPMPEIVRLLGRYDCFGHKGTSEEQYVLEFQYGARMLMSNYEETYNYLTKSINEKTNMCVVENNIHDKGSTVYSYLCSEAKHIYAKRFDIHFTSIKTTNTDNALIGEGKTIKFACINHTRFNPINFGIDYHKDGYDGVACFWYEQSKLCFSLYNDNGLVDCSQIAKQYGGGGHKGASGFIIQCSKHYNGFTINNLIDALSSVWY